MNKLLATAKTWHYKFADLVSYLQSPFLLFVRLYWGVQLVQSGWGKLHHLANVTEFFTSLGLPAPALHCGGHLLPGIFRRHPLRSRLVLAAARACAHHQHAHGIHHRGSRSALLFFLQPRKILWSGSLYFPFRIRPRAALRPRVFFARQSSNTYIRLDRSVARKFHRAPSRKSFTRVSSN